MHWSRWQGGAGKQVSRDPTTRSTCTASTRIQRSQAPARQGRFKLSCRSAPGNTEGAGTVGVHPGCQPALLHAPPVPAPGEAWKPRRADVPDSSPPPAPARPPSCTTPARRLPGAGRRGAGRPGRRTCRQRHSASPLPAARGPCRAAAPPKLSGFGRSHGRSGSRSPGGAGAAGSATRGNKARRQVGHLHPVALGGLQGGGWWRHCPTLQLKTTSGCNMQVLAADGATPCQRLCGSRAATLSTGATVGV